MIVSIIVAMSRNQVIGAANRLPWRLPSDSARFKRLTLNHNVIVGRKSYESILGYLGKPLPNRTMIVVTHGKVAPHKDVKIASSFEEALKMAQGDEVFIIGGSQIYTQALPVTDKIYLTKVEATIQGDAYFPILDKNEWETMSEEAHPADETHNFAYTFIDMKRK